MDQGQEVLTPILRREGVTVSVPMVGRILSSLKRQRLLLPDTLADPQHRERTLSATLRHA